MFLDPRHLSGFVKVADHAYLPPVNVGAFRVLVPLLPISERTVTSFSLGAQT